LSNQTKKESFQKPCATTNSVDHNRWWWPNVYQKKTVSFQSYGKAVSRAQKVSFSISQHYMREYSSRRSGKIITTDFIVGFITNNSRILSVPNKIIDLP
jgi:hypothetical protein